MALRSASQYLWVLDVLVFKRLNCTLLPFFSSYLLFPYLCGSKCQTCKCDMTNNCMISENKCNLMYIKHLQSYILLIFNALRITVGFPQPLISPKQTKPISSDALEAPTAGFRQNARLRICGAETMFCGF